MKSKSIIALLLIFIMSISLCACGEKVCSECEGTKLTSCSECSGEGKYDCSEPTCENGVVGTGCNNCFGREEVIICTKCDGEQKESRICEQCNGDGIIVNPITWEEFGCGECDGEGRAEYKCSRCEGYGLICTYCDSDAINYPSKEFHPYFEDCEVCSGIGTLTCYACDGAKEVPCATCSEEEYQEFVSEVENKVAEEISEEAKENIIDEAKTILSGITSDYPTYYAEPLTQEMIDSAVTLLNEFEGDFEEKTKLLNELERIEPYYNTSWEFVEGNPKLFMPSATSEPEMYKFEFTYNRESFYFRVYAVTNGSDLDGQIFHLATDCPYVFYYSHGSDEYKVFLNEEENLLFEQYDYDGNVSDSCVLKKISN